jgi:hypothetical protein
VKDQALHVVGERELGFGAFDADHANEQTHRLFMPSEHMLDASTDLGLCGIPAPHRIRLRLASQLLAMDAADPALPFEPLRVGLVAIGGVCPDVGGGIVAGADIAQHPPVKACAIGDLAFADEP